MPSYDKNEQVLDRTWIKLKTVMLNEKLKRVHAVWFHLYNILRSEKSSVVTKKMKQYLSRFSGKVYEVFKNSASNFSVPSPHKTEWKALCLTIASLRILLELIQGITKIWQEEDKKQM